MKAFTVLVNFYINKHMMTNLSTHIYQIWVSGERKRKHIDTKRHTLMQTSMLSLLYMPQQSCNDVSSIFIHYAILWIIYGFTNRYLWILFLILWTYSSCPRVLCQESVAEIVQNLLRNSSRIHSRRCVVPHPWQWKVKVMGQHLLLTFENECNTLFIWYTPLLTYFVGTYVRHVTYSVDIWYTHRVTYSVGIWYARHVT